jgi:outer membrane immunogenic protein
MDVGVLGVNYRLGAADPFALVAATSAADMNVPGGYKDTYVPNTWSGFYIGVNGGWGWSAHNDVYATADTAGLQPEGGFGGGQIGYNWQSGQLVFGVEADIQGSGIGDKRPVLGPINLNSDLDWFGTVRGRLGYASGPLLLYATGGFAYGEIRNEVNFLPPHILFKDHATATGFAVGGGYEHKFSPAWSIKTEYQFINLGRNDPIAFGANLCTPGVFKCHDDAFHTVRAGINYHFGSGYEGGSYKDGSAYVGVNWAGWYAGVNGGYGWSEFDDQLLDHNASEMFNGLSPSGGFGGGQIGYNWQGIWHPRLVLGVEVDIQGADIGDSRLDNSNLAKVPVRHASQLDWFGSVRGRLGYASGPALFYGTGGFAYGNVRNDVRFLQSGTEFKADNTATGYTVGGGVEYEINSAWSAKVEYQYLNLGKNDPVRTTDGVPFSNFIGTKVEDDAFHTVRAGVNYHFARGYEPLK